METEKKSETKSRSSKTGRKSRFANQQQKTYKTDIESMASEDVEMEGLHSPNDDFEIVKHSEEKNFFNQSQFRIKFEKMKYMLDCGFNLLVYGCGSKADVLNLFQLKHMSNGHTLIFRAFDSRCTMKNIVECIVNWFL